jgi:hypothetical protein
MIGRITSIVPVPKLAPPAAWRWLTDSFVERIDSRHGQLPFASPAREAAQPARFDAGMVHARQSRLRSS